MNTDLEINKPSQLLSPSRQKKPRASSMKATIKVKPTKAGKPNPADNKPDVKIYQDPATANMKNLKQVKFLNVDDNQVNQLIDGKPILEKTGQLAKEYLARKKTMNASVLKVINASNIAHMEILKKNEKDKEEERKKKSEERNNSSPLVAGLLGTLDSETKPIEEEQTNKLADGFVRSNRNMALRVKNQIDIQMQELEGDKTKLVQKLNDALIKLDGLNTNKRLMSQKLVEQIQFVRDLHKATGGAGVEDIQSIVSDEIKNEYKREKELHKVLDDQLTRADQERCEILERLKLFTGEKEIVVINQDGQRRSFKVTSVNIERLMNEIKETKAEISQVDHAISRAREVFNNSEGEMQIKERQMHALCSERNMIFEKTQDLHQRHDHAVVALQNEKRRANQMHKMHVKLLSMRIFEETMQKVLFRNRELAFEQLQRTTEISAHKSGAVLAFRKVLLNTQYRYARRLLHKWFQQVCDPVKRGAVFSKLPVYYDKSELMVYFYYKWRALYQAKSTRKMQNKQGAITVSHLLSRLDLKVTQIFFMKWRMRFSRASSKLQLIVNRLLKSQSHLIQDAMEKWRSVMFDQTFCARLHSLQIQLNEKQMERFVFSAWVGYIIQRKNKMRSLKHRVIKNLRVNVARKKFRQLMDGKNKIISREQDLRIKQKIINAFKYFKEKQLLRKTMLKIDSDITPTMKNVNGLIHDFRLKQELNQKYRAVCSLVINPTQRLINEYLQHWRTITEQKKWKFFEGTKRLLLRTHSCRLQTAFNKWRTQRSQVVIQHQQANIDDIDNQIAQTELQKSKIQASINDQHKSNKVLGSKQLKKLCERAMQQHLHFQFLKWRACCVAFKKQQTALEKACRSYKKRFMRMASDRYKAFTLQERINFNNQYKLRNLDLRKQYSLIKTVFKAILQFSKQHIECTNGMRRLTKTIDRHNQRASIKQWCIITKIKRETHLFSTEQSAVQNLDCFVNEIGTLQNLYQKTNQSKERLVSILRLQSKEIMKKWFVRFHYGGMQYGFKTWHKASLNIKHRNNYLSSLILHLEKNTLRQTFSKWLNLKHSQIKERIEGMISKKVLDVRENDFSVSMIKLDCQKSVGEIKTQINIVRQQIQTKTVTFTKTFETLVGIKERNFSYNKLRLYLNGWRQFTTNRNKSCLVLARGLTRMCLQKSFNHINSLQQESKRHIRHLKVSSRLDQIVDRMAMRKAMNKWNFQLFKIDKSLIAISVQSQQQHIEVFQQEKVVIQQNYVSKVQITVKANLLQKKFRLWRQFVMFAKSSRYLQIKAVELKSTRLVQLAVKLMHERAQTTKKYRQLIYKFKESRRLKLLTKCFRRGFKAESRINKNLCSLIEQLHCKLKASTLERAFKHILYITDIKIITQKMQKKQTARSLAKSLDKMLTKRFRYSIEQLRQFTHFDKANYLKLRACLMIKPMVSLRQWFLSWKLRSIKKSVVIENETGCGPTNLEAWALQMQCSNLKSMMRDDGQTVEFVTSYEQKNEERAKQLIEKSVTRMMIFKDEDLCIMPYFFDKLRKNAILRKKWRPKLNFIERLYLRVQNMDQSLLTAFKTWQKAVNESKQYLEATPKLILVDRFYKNRMEMNVVAERVEEKIQTIDVMTNQRDVLFTGYVGSQRLALGYTKAHFVKIQQKALMKLNDQGNKALQTRIQAALAQNLGLIEQLKNRISDLEADNSQAAQLSEGNRPGALDAIHCSRDVVALQQDIDHLNFDLSDKADTIKRLIEDNKYLKQRLEDKHFDHKNATETNYGRINQDQIENQSNLRNKGLQSSKNAAPTLKANVGIGGTASLRTTPARSQIASPLRLAPTFRK